MRLRILVLLALLAVPAQAAAEPIAPSEPECLALAAGSTGLPEGSAMPATGAATGPPGGIGPVATVPLPDAVVFKTAKQTFTDDYAFVLRKGDIYVRRATLGRGTPGEDWHELALPECLAGHVTAISGDATIFLALGRNRQLYSHDMPDGDLSADHWTGRWGPYFWAGPGIRLWEDAKSLEASALDPDRWFTDSSGVERHPIGVLTGYVLRGDARRITLLDPWLPNDESRELCGPRRGTVALASLSASGSTAFVAARSGELWTRLYDFDTSGANTVFGKYSWQDGRPATDERWQLPGPRWKRHPRPPGRFTDRITIAMSGLHSYDRELRVAGRRRGRPGYWVRPIAASRRDGWTFVRARGVAGGHRLPARGRSRAFTPDDRRYIGAIDGARATLRDFNASARRPTCASGWRRASRSTSSSTRPTACARRPARTASTTRRASTTAR